MSLYVFCGSFGLLLALASLYFTSLQRTVTSRLRRPSMALACLLGLCFSLLVYACAKDVAVFNVHALINALAALGCGIAICAIGTLFVITATHPVSDPQKISLASGLRSIDVPGLLMLLVMFTGLIYHRWFK